VLIYHFVQMNRNQMLSALNIWLDTPRRRLLFVLVVEGLSIGLLTQIAGSVWVRRVVALTVAGFGILLVRRFWSTWSSVRKRVLRWEMRIVKSWRQFAKPSPVVQAFHLLGLALGFFWSSIYVGLQVDAKPLLWSAMFVLGIAGVCEITVQMGKVWRKAWAPVLGKILAVSLGVALAALALSSAKKVTHAISPIDPKYMSEFTTIVAAFYLPIVYLAMAGVAVAAYALFQVFVFWLVSMAGMFTEQLKPILGENKNARLRLYWYRIRCGKRPRGSVLPPAASLDSAGISLLASPISKMIVATVLVSGVQEISKLLPLATGILTRTMVEVEYKENSGCKDLPRGVRVVYMDDGNVSIAERNLDGYTFKVGTCKY
jgi:hypothetical protein